MVAAWYMKFRDGHSGCLDRVGGLPTHLPPKWPRSSDGERDLRFLAQVHCDGTRLSLGETFLLQIYQDIPEGDVGPVVVKLAHDAKQNARNEGQPDPGVKPFDIQWEYREDPDDSEQIERVDSKLWGTCFFSRVIGEGKRLLLTFDEDPACFNFGGDELMLAINGAGEIFWVGA
jgi:hypothetical protein